MTDDEFLKKLKLDKSEDLPYPCEVCGSSFKTPCALSKHQHFFCTGNWDIREIVHNSVSRRILRNL